MSRVVLAMSGGVDSSVAAHLLLEAGHEVIGVFMRHGENSPAAACASGTARPAQLPIVSRRADHKQGCCSASDAADARRVAERLDIPFYALNLEKEFGRIIDYFVREYVSGRTPNPCVVCNHQLKFGKLFAYADSVGAEHVATGHYARLLPGKSGERPALCRGRDAKKDQSYVLFGIQRELLPRMLLPVGDYEKPDIRDMASGLGLHLARKRDSQEICFVTSGDHAEFVRGRSQADLSGELVTTEGKVVGRHDGIEKFTIGQRKGLGVALGEPRFVVGIEPETRRVIIGRREELGRRELTAGETNWLVEPPAGPFPCHAQIRYNSPAAPAVAQRIGPDRLHVAFDSPRIGVAPGQAVVCYDGARLLGGGWIE